MIQRVLEVTSIERLAQDLDVSWNTIWSWKSGKRRPSRESRQRLAAWLRRQSDEFVNVAEVLEQSVRDEEAGRGDD